MEIIGTSQIYDTLPEITEEVDCMYCNPPAGISSLTETMPGKYFSYEEYARQFFQYIDTVRPKTLYIEVGVTNFELVYTYCKERFSYVSVDRCWHGYRTGRRCWIIRCGKDDSTLKPPGTDIGTKRYIRWVCRNSDYRNIVHMYLTTDGWLELQAYKSGIKTISIIKPGQKKDSVEKLVKKIKHTDIKHKTGGKR